jgi:solute carrier family 25 folate transporter 32
VLSLEGVRGFYRGMSPAVVASSIAWGGYFYFYEISKGRKLRASTNPDGSSGKLGTWDIVTAGIEAGSVMVLLTNPLWLIRTRLALQGNGSSISSGSGLNNNSSSIQRYKGLTDAFVTIIREEGFRGLYRGAVPALLLTTHGSIQFAVYEFLKEKSSEVYGTSQPPWVSMSIGGISKIMASTATYPYQVIKSRLQQRESGIQTNHPSGSSASSSPAGPKYTTTRDCIMKIWKNEGFVGFFRGFSLNVMKVAPAAAITFVVYEETLKLLRGI